MIKIDDRYQSHTLTILFNGTYGDLVQLLEDSAINYVAPDQGLQQSNYVLIIEKPKEK